ncbi:hypothetical protein [Bradyrhizobium sp. URHC0002]
MSLDPNKLLAAIPAGLRDPLFETYREIASNFAEHRWEPSELNGGKFCECAYWICHGFVTGTYAAIPSKPPNMRDNCRDIERLTNSGKPGDHSLRILIPRMLPALYDIRNNRGVGHVGGDVDPNFMDATAVYSTTSWILAELVRVFHNVKTTEAQAAVDGLVERKTPLIWSAGIAKRVLDDKMSAAEQTLLLLHQALAWVSETDLLKSIEYSNPSVYRSKVLTPLHKARKIEFDKVGQRAHISPKGSAFVEEKIIAPRAGWKNG